MTIFRLQDGDVSQASSGLGNTLLENVFSSNPNVSPIATFQLARSEVEAESAGGIFTIGEIVSNMSAVQQQPQLPLLSSSRWVVAMDAMIVNGRTIKGNSA